MSATVVLGMQWGDEGKGRIVDMLADGADAVIRYNGGNNAGHTVIHEGQRYGLHLVPAGVFRPGVTNIVGPGCVADLGVLTEEVGRVEAALGKKPLLFLSDRIHIILPVHKMLDAMYEDQRGGANLGTTRSGNGPVYAQKAQRHGVRLGDLLAPGGLNTAFHAAEKISDCLTAQAAPHTLWRMAKQAVTQAETLREFVADTTSIVRDLRQRGADIVVEGAHGAMLDLNHGAYPFVTSSDCTPGGICAGAGFTLDTANGDKVIGVIKAYSTRIGPGPFPTEIHDPKMADQIRTTGREWGTTTGRPRRIGWLDLPALRYAKEICGVRRGYLTLLDVLTGREAIPVCRAYLHNGEITERIPSQLKIYDSYEPIFAELEGWHEDISTCKTYPLLPLAAKKYVEYVEQESGIRIDGVSVGPERGQFLWRW
jgi:adenylosuccinate synthase